MNDSLKPGWVDAVARDARSDDPDTRAPALGEPRRCFRVDQSRTARSRRRGSARGPASRYALRNLPPIEE